MKEHIIINKDRTVVVPDSVRKIGIQYDHKVNTLTFDCPRYADDNQSIDMSRMAIYINFSRNDKTKGSVAATNIFVDPDDPEIMHFDVVITRSVTLVNGPIICLVCAKSTDAEGVEVNHWNSELFNKLSVGEGLEAEELTEEEIDYITSLLQEINTTRAEVADMDTRVEDLEFNQEKQGVVSEVDLEAMTWTEGSYITGSGTIGSSGGYGISELVTLPKMSTLILDATGYQSDVAMIAKSDHTPLVTSVDGKTHYEYYTDEEIQVYISCKTTVAKSAKIVRNVAETLSDLERENSKLKGDLVDIEDVTGIDTSVKKIGSATSGSSAWTETNIITNLSLDAHKDYIIIFSVENSAHDTVYCHLADSNGTKLVSQQIADGSTSVTENYISNESLSNCRLYFQYGKKTGITVNASIDYAYYPKDYVSTLMDSMVENGFTFDLENKENVAYTNYFLYKLHRNANETLYFELEDKTSKDINVLATYKDGSREILCGLSANTPKRMVTLTKELVGIGAYLPPNYTKSTLLVYGDYKNDVLDRMKTLSFENSAFGTFAKFGVIGDSLSVGYMGDSSGTAHGRNIYYSWGQVLARRYGNKCLNFGFSGATTETWYTNETHGKVELVQEQNKCQAYVVGLGVNDTVTESNVGNANDINLSDYTQNANTFYGNYAKVLQTIMETAPTAYIFVFTIPKTKGTNRFSEIKNNAIKGVVAKLASDRVFVIETNDYSELFNLDVITDNSYSSHYTAIGYANIATINAIMLSDCMNSNADKLKDIAFIPYGNNDVIN